MLKIKTPATSANLAVGFDSAGIALNLYNTFEFSPTDKDTLSGFLKQFNGEDNLVLETYYRTALQFLKKDLIQKIHIKLIEGDIPFSRGLGSSASCILAGVLASNHFNHLGLTFKACVDLACEYEGHSDNVFACAYGGLTITTNDKGEYLYKQVRVSDCLYFHLLIPEKAGSTKELRHILPQMVSLEDATYNLSRMAFLVDAFRDGDFYLLTHILKDKLHQPYRYHTLPLYADIDQLSKHDQMIVCISGSGPTVLLISDKKEIKVPRKFHDLYKIVPVKISEGTKVEVQE